jgi:Kef-type K+ transport system membrane component KefB
MHDIPVVSFLANLVVILLSAKVFAEIAERLGQPPVLGELLGGVVLGFGFVPFFHPNDPTLSLMAEIGVLLLLFETGLESDLKELMRAGPLSLAVACVGVVTPFLLGYGVMRGLGRPGLEDLVVGAALTATSVGITARVLKDLGRLGTTEAQIILGAAVIDDILGLVILSAIQGIAEAGQASWGTIARTAFMAFAFLAAALFTGTSLSKRLIAWTRPLRSRDALVIVSICFAAALSLLAHACGTALIVGAFTAGILLAQTDRGDEIHGALKPVAGIFVPIFFVMVGTKVDLSHFNPWVAENRPMIALAGLLSLVAVIGKLGSGWAVWQKGLNRWGIGIGMVPRGEVGLIFAQTGLAMGAIDKPLYAALIGMVVITTFITPPLLKKTFSR